TAGHRTLRTAFRSWFRRSLTHLPICTLQKPCQFRTTSIYPRLNRAFRNLERLRNLFVIHILQVPQDDSLPQLWGELRQRILHHLLGLLLLDPLIWRKSLVFNLFRESLPVLFVPLGGIHRIRKSFILRLAEVVHQEV